MKETESTTATVSVEVPIYYPILGPERAAQQLDPAIAELKGFPKEVFDGPYFQTTSLIVTIESANQVELPKYALDHLDGVIEGMCPKIKWAAEIVVKGIPIQDADGKPSTLPIKDCETLCKQLAVEHLARRISQLLIASQLAKPGIIRTRKLSLFVSDTPFCRQDAICGHLDEALHYANEIGWPKVQSLSTADVWNWLQGIDCFVGGFGRTSVGRALCAFTHLLSNKRGNGQSGEKLLWAMIGLESLYGRMTSDLTFQLVEKSRALLGRHENFDKLVKKMYSYRSEFVHGKAPIPSTFFDGGSAREDFELFEDKSYNSSMLATAVLIATLQQIAIKGWKNLSFTFTADDPPRQD